MKSAGKTQREERRRQVDVWIAGLGILVAAAAGLGGALGGAAIASSAADRQIDNDQIAVLRQERVTVFAAYLTQLDRRISPDTSRVEEISRELLDRWQQEQQEQQDYESSLQQARLYASARQLALIDKLDDLIIDLVDSTDEVEQQARIEFDAARDDLLELLREDLQFASDR